MPRWVGDSRILGLDSLIPRKRGHFQLVSRVLTYRHQICDEIRLPERMESPRELQRPRSLPYILGCRLKQREGTPSTLKFSDSPVAPSGCKLSPRVPSGRDDISFEPALCLSQRRRKASDLRGENARRVNALPARIYTSAKHRERHVSSLSLSLSLSLVSGKIIIFVRAQ